MRKFLIALFLFLFFIGACFAYGELTSYYKTKFLGLNNKVNPRLLADDESIDLSNITLDETGAFRDRDVFGYYNTASGDLGNNYITGLFKFYKTNAKYFIACAGSKICSGSAGVWTNITQAGLSVTSGSYWTAVTFNNELYLFNETCAMQNWTGTGLTTTPGGVPTTNCAFSAVHKNRVWAAKSTSAPYRLYYSSLNNAEDWTTTGGYIDLPDMTQTISGIVSWGGYLYIFTETNIFVLLGSTPNDFSMRKSNSQVGAIAPRSIKVTDIGICFLARTGVFAFDGNSSTKLSDKIEPTINSISKTKVQNAAGLYDGQTRYWLAYTDSTGSFNNKIIIYDIGLKEWYKYDSLSISYFERAYGGTDRGELYGGSSIVNGVVYNLQSATGTESITHSTEADFEDCSTFNTVVNTIPAVYNKPLFDHSADGFTEVMLHMEGTDGSGTFTDEPGRATAHIFTQHGAAQIDTANKYLGASSMLNSVDGDYITTPNSPDWDFGTGDFEFSCAFYMTASEPSNANVLISTTDWAATTKGFFVMISGTNGILLNVADGAGAFTLTISVSYSFSLNTWYRLSLIRHDSVLTFYVNGEAIYSEQVTDTIDSDGTLFIGYGNTVQSSFLGWIDEVKIIKGEIPHASSGHHTSQPIAINAAGTTTLDKISWVDSTTTNEKIAFQTRTGVTSDTVYFNGWQYWSSDSTVTFDTVTDGTVAFTSSDATNFTVKKPTSAQARNILHYEEEDSASPNCVFFTASGVSAKNDYADETVVPVDLSSYNWLEGWIKTPATGNSVEFYIGEGEAKNYTTFNTVNINTWEKWYWYIGDISSTDRDAINYVRVKYKGEMAGNIVLGETSGKNYYSSGDVMDSTPNDYIQYRAIFGGPGTSAPELTSVTLVYTPVSGSSESSLSSYYQTKPIDFGSPQINKQFLELFVEMYNDDDSTTCNTVVYIDYDIDDGAKTGTMTYNISTTGNTVRQRKYFSSNAFGKTMKLKYRHSDKNANVTVRAMEIRYRPEAFND